MSPWKRHFSSPPYLGPNIWQLPVTRRSVPRFQADLMWSTVELRLTHFFSSILVFLPWPKHLKHHGNYCALVVVFKILSCLFVISLDLTPWQWWNRHMLHTNIGPCGSGFIQDPNGQKCDHLTVGPVSSFPRWICSTAAGGVHSFLPHRK